MDHEYAVGDREDLDPRWEWYEARRLADPEPRWIKGWCRHTELVPVESVSGEVVAQLCLTCDGQVPVDWRARG